MKQGIHPEYMETTVTCSCGESFITRGTTPEIRVELCNQCHPFYTGKQKLVDTGGRIDRFERRYGRRRKGGAAEATDADAAADAEGAADAEQPAETPADAES